MLQRKFGYITQILRGFRHIMILDRISIAETTYLSKTIKSANVLFNLLAY